MIVNELNYSFKELQHILDIGTIHKLVEYKMNEAGFYKCTELADKEGIKRQAMSQRIADNPDGYVTVEFGKYLYAKKK